MTTVLIVRHGESTWNAEGRIQGHLDSPLSPLGLRQAQAVGRRLATHSIDAIHSSDLSRTVDTISPAAEKLGLPVLTVPELREKSFGEWEGLTPQDIEVRYPGMWQQYRSNRGHDTTFRIPGAEMWEQVQTRAVGAVEKIVATHAPKDTVAIATHGGTLRMLVLHAMNAPLSSLFHLSVDNAGLTRIDYGDIASARVVFFNDRCHLENVD